MFTLISAVSAIWIPLLIFFQPPPPGSLLNSQNCQIMIDQYVNNQAAWHEIIHPSVTDEAQIRLTLERYLSLQTCIKQLPADQITPEIQTLELVSSLFLVFAGGDDFEGSNSRLMLVDLEESTDPAIVLLRDQIGISPPSGLVFIRFYSSRQSLPGLLKPAFENPEVAGVTIFSKYIAIIDETPASWAEQTLKTNALPGTISHELVHAYINGLITNPFKLEGTQFPKWYIEGLATYLSKSGKPHTVITPGITVSQTATQDYQDYLLIFQFLEAKAGKRTLYEKINQTVLTGEITPLLQIAGAPNEVWLLSMADSWYANRLKQRALFVAAVIGVSAFGLFIFLPDYQCQCGFTGRKNDFIAARCPACGRVSSVNRRWLPARRRIQFLPTCQVCWRRFWPWQREGLETNILWKRVWITNSSGAKEPIPRYIHHVCIECLTASASLEAGYQNEIERQLPGLKEQFSKSIQRWLTSAPRPVGLDHVGIQEVEFDRLVDDLVESTLSIKFGEWLPVELEFNWNDLDNFTWNQLFDIENLALPFSNIVLNRDRSKIGSLYLKADGLIVISWLPMENRKI